MRILHTLAALAAAVAGVFFWLACAAFLVALVALGRRHRPLPRFPWQPRRASAPSTFDRTGRRAPARSGEDENSRRGCSQPAAMAHEDKLMSKKNPTPKKIARVPGLRFCGDVQNQNDGRAPDQPLLPGASFRELPDAARRTVYPQNPAGRIGSVEIEESGA